MTKNGKAHRSITILAVAVLVAWIAAAGVGGPYFGRVAEVSSNDSTAYLPNSADATRVRELQASFSGADAIPAIVVFESDAAMASDDLAGLTAALSGLAGVAGVQPGMSPAIPSRDGEAAQAFVLLDTTADLGDTVAAMRESLQQSLPDGTRSWVTGPAGFVADLAEGFKGIDGILLGAALGVVFLILLFVYRSLLLPVAVLLTSMSALTVALLIVWWLAKAGFLILSGQTQGILFILVIGAATDYSLLYVSRYREALRSEQNTWLATRMALRGSFEPIIASGGTVIAGLMCLLLSDLKSNSTLGPIAAVGIIMAMLAALTLLPAMLQLFGRASFWPRAPKFEPEVVQAEHGIPQRGIWARLARFIPLRPRAIWLLTTAVLLAGCLGLTQLRATGVAQSELVLGTSEARDGQLVLGEHFDAGSGSPVIVVAPQQLLQQASDALLGHSFVTGVSVVTADTASGTAPVDADGIRSFGPGPVQPTVVDGRVMLQATLADSADSVEAIQAVRELRGELHALGPDVLVGGVTATALDTNDASIHDRSLIIPVVLGVILLILMLLLRSVLAPVLLIASTVLSFGTALGIAALLFNGPFGFAGADPAVPLYAFVFLVALGIDYNIFLMTRVREEAREHGTREGMLRGLAITGGVITSAGIVLAATFAALGVIPILFLLQIAFIVAFGVLLDTFVIRSLLVPALVYDLGSVIWWPSRFGRRQG